MKLLFVLLAGLPLAGQTLRLSSASGTAGDAVAIVVYLDSPAGRSPSALEWQIIFPVQVLEMEKDGFEAGTAAKKSGKSITCSARKEYLYNCILAGGRKPIANGAIAILHLKIRKNARNGPSSIRLEKAVGVTPDLTEFLLESAEGVVTIQ